MKKLILLLALIFLVSGCTGQTPSATDAVDSLPSPEEQLPMTGISVISAPGSASSGDEVTVRWDVTAPSDSEFPHTAIHYDTESHGGNFDLTVGPDASGYPELTPDFAGGDFESDEFEVSFVVSETTYFRAHAIVNGQNYWTDEMIIAVGAELAPSVVEIDMIARQWEFIPSVITVNEGDLVRLHITSEDVRHGFNLRQFSGASGILNPGEETNLEFIADTKGSYVFSCTVPCGSGHSGMRGTLVVQ